MELPKSPEPSAPSERGWVRYVWLVFLSNLLWQPLLDPDYPTLYRWLSVAAVLGFLPLYFKAMDAQGWPLIRYTALMVLMGVLLTPINGGAGSFLIYAAAAVAYYEVPHIARRLVFAYSLAVIPALALASPPSASAALFFLPVAFMTITIGLINHNAAEQQRYNRRLRQAQQENQRLAAIAERERIARDLHDVLGHTLSLIVLKAELSRKLAAKAPAKAESEMAEVERIARDALAQVREVVRGYRGSLSAELTQAQQSLQQAGITPDIAVPPIALPAAYEGGLALVLREAVTNVLRHSGASHCWIGLEDLPHGLKLSVRDNGKGLQGASEGSGMLGMQERVAALGGRLHTQSDGGTHLTVWLPPLERYGSIVAS